MNSQSLDAILSNPAMKDALYMQAQHLGIDPTDDHAFLYIAAKSLVAPTPEGWEQGRTDDDNIYWYNKDTVRRLLLP